MLSAHDAARERAGLPPRQTAEDMDADAEMEAEAAQEDAEEEEEQVEEEVAEEDEWYRAAELEYEALQQ